MKRIVFSVSCFVLVLAFTAVPCFAQCGIWKEDALTSDVNFYVQSYDTLDDAVVAIYSPNAQDFAAFLDTDVESMVIDADDLGGFGHHLTMTFTDEDHATATLTLAGSAPMNYTLIRSFVGFGKGEQGDPGPAGPQGPAGATGSQGPVGPADVYQNSTVVSIAATTSGTCTAPCDSGDKVTGGGWYAYTTSTLPVALSPAAPVEPGPGPIGPIKVTEYPAVGYSYANSAMDGWLVKAYNGEPHSINLTCYAVCADVAQ